MNEIHEILFRECVVAQQKIDEIKFNLFHLRNETVRLDRVARESERIIKDLNLRGAGGVVVGTAAENAIRDRCIANEACQKLRATEALLREAEATHRAKVNQAIEFQRKLETDDLEAQSASRSISSSLALDDGIASCLSESEIERESSCQVGGDIDNLSEDGDAVNLEDLLAIILSELKAQIDEDKSLNKNIDTINAVYDKMGSIVSDFKNTKDYQVLNDNLTLCIERGINNLNTIDCKIYNTYIYCLNLIKDICNLFINLMPNPSPYPKSQFFKSPWTSKLESIKGKLDVVESIDSDDEEEKEDVLALN